MLTVVDKAVVEDAFCKAEWARNAARKFARNDLFVGMLARCVPAGMDWLRSRSRFSSQFGAWKSESSY